MDRLVPSLRGDRHVRIASLVALVLVGSSMVRGLGPGTEFGKSAFELSYRDGFVRRGLPGTLISILGVSASSEVVQWVNYGWTTVLVVLWCWLVWRSFEWLRTVEHGVWFYVVMAGSAGVVSFAQFNGSFDAPIAVCAIVAVLLVIEGRPGWSSIVVGVGVLIHENILVMAIPVGAVVILMRSSEEHLGVALRSVRRDLARFVAVPAVVFTLSVVAQALTLPGDYQERYRSILIERGYSARSVELIPVWIVRTFPEWLRMEAPHAPRRFLELSSLLMYGGTALLLGSLLLVATGPRSRWAIPWRTAALPIAGLFPTALFFIAFDTNRIWGFCGVNLVLVVYFAARAGIPVGSPGKWFVAASAVIITAEYLFEQYDTDGGGDRLPLIVRLIIATLVLAGTWWWERQPGLTNEANELRTK